MKKVFAIAAVVAGLGVASSVAQAQGYVVNGQAASPAEVQRLVSHGVQPGHWVVTGYGIASDEIGQSGPATSGSAGSKCWYVLDAQICE